MCAAEPIFNANAMNPTHTLAVLVALSGLFLWLAFLTSR